MEEYRQLFESIDNDGDGKITLKEQCTAIRKLQEFSEINVDYILMALTMFGKIDLTKIEDSDSDSDSDFEIDDFLQDKRAIHVLFY
jgi:Ca2+-binding EF-hand superfamily protein